MMYQVKNVLKLNNPITYGLLQIYIDGVCVRDQFEYSWSSNGVCWSSYVDFYTYENICKNLDSDYYLRVLVDTTNFPTIFNDGVEYKYNITIYNPNPFETIICDDCFDIYDGWDCAMQMQQSLTDAVVCMTGIPIYYFKVEPDVETANYTFKEYVMHSVKSVKQLKMVVTDGVMPSSKPMLTDWDFTFETDWEVELSKSHFAAAFGDTSYPRSRDFIWVPMQKRMYEVNSAYDEKNDGLMWQSYTWKLALVKYNDKTNIQMDNDIESYVNELLVNTYDNTFKILEHEEQRDTGVIELSSPKYASNNIYSLTNQDYLRKSMSVDNISISPRQINHNNIIVAKSMYTFERDAVIEYNDGFCSNDGSIIMVFDTPISHIDEERVIFEFGYNQLIYNNGSLEFGNSKVNIDSGSTYMLFIRWNYSLMICEIFTYKYTYPIGVPKYKIKPAMYSFDTSSTGNTSMYAGDLQTTTCSTVYMYGYPLNISSFKLYEEYISDDHLAELFKYTTNNKKCIINDIARPLNGAHGYSVK